jgi:hypothetical protein
LPIDGVLPRHERKRDGSLASQNKLNAAFRYNEIVRKLVKHRGVSFPKDRKGFGSSALWVSGKMLAFLSSKDELVVKLPEDRVNALVKSGCGARCDPSHGRPMKQMVGDQ